MRATATVERVARVGQFAFPPRHRLDRDRRTMFALLCLGHQVGDASLGTRRGAITPPAQMPIVIVACCLCEKTFICPICIDPRYVSTARKRYYASTSDRVATRAIHANGSVIGSVGDIFAPIDAHWWLARRTIAPDSDAQPRVPSTTANPNRKQTQIIGATSWLGTCRHLI